jgi:hypothetical protein
MAICFEAIRRRAYRSYGARGNNIAE